MGSQDEGSRAGDAEGLGVGCDCSCWVLVVDERGEAEVEVRSGRRRREASWNRMVNFGSRLVMGSVKECVFCLGREVQVQPCETSHRVPCLASNRATDRNFGSCKLLDVDGQGDPNNVAMRYKYRIRRYACLLESCRAVQFRAQKPVLTRVCNVIRAAELLRPLGR